MTKGVTIELYIKKRKREIHSAYTIVLSIAQYCDNYRYVTHDTNLIFLNGKLSFLYVGRKVWLTRDTRKRVVVCQTALTSLLPTFWFRVLISLKSTQLLTAALQKFKSVDKNKVLSIRTTEIHPSNRNRKTQVKYTNSH